jgi:hypothetical protein
MPFGVFNLFFPVVVGALLAPATLDGRDDGASTAEAPLVGAESFATWGVSAAERARSHG